MNKSEHSCNVTENGRQTEPCDACAAEYDEMAFGKCNSPDPAHRGVHHLREKSCVGWKPSALSVIQADVLEKARVVDARLSIAIDALKRIKSIRTLGPGYFMSADQAIFTAKALANQAIDDIINIRRRTL